MIVGANDSTAHSWPDNGASGSASAGHFRVVALRLLELAGQTQTHAGKFTVGVTSCLIGEGVTTVARQLAVAATRVLPAPVLLVQAEDHRAVESTMPLDERVQPTDVPHLAVLSCSMTPDPETFHKGLQSIEANYRLILVDMPPAGQSHAACQLARLLDGILLVLQAERVSLRMMQQVKENLDRHGARVLGAVLNKVRWQTAIS